MTQTKGAIAGGHPQTVAAGRAILALGGNAFDAAIGSLLAATVVESTLTSLGGGGFLLAHRAAGPSTLFDFFCQTPLQKPPRESLDFYRVELDFGGAIQGFHVGLGSMAIPGVWAGILAVHRRLGRLPLKELAAPAVDLARHGFTVTPYQAFCYRLLAPILLATPAGRVVYAPQGSLLQEGDRCVMPDYARTLEDLVHGGEREFYEGAIAAQMVADCGDRGGYLRREDFVQYQVIERSPLRHRYRHYELITNPPPSSGGALIACALHLLAPFDLHQFPLGSAVQRHLFAEVMRQTNQARSRGYDQRLYEENIAQDFLDPAHLLPYQTALQTLNKWGSTTHISVLDGEGNAASVTSSNGEGSTYLIPGTGIMVNNMLGEEDLNPLGFHQWPCDRRMSSMMAPSLLLENHRPRWVLGSGGSNRIRTAIFQVISHLVDYDQTLVQAIDHPRIHWENQVLNLEPPHGGHMPFPADLGEVNYWQEQNMFFGGVHGVGCHIEGQWSAVGDRRREGAGAISP